MDIEADWFWEQTAQNTWGAIKKKVLAITPENATAAAAAAGGNDDDGGGK